MKLPGYFLLECLCYIAITTLIIFFLMRTIVTTTVSLKKTCKTNTALCQIFAAHQLLEHDLHGAPQSMRDWKLLSDTALIWKSNDTDRGWLFEKNKLSRIHGLYNYSQEKWTKKVKHIVARGIERLTFTVKRNGSEHSDVQAVNYVIAAHGTPFVLDHTVMIQNRKL